MRFSRARALLVVVGFATAVPGAPAAGQASSANATAGRLVLSTKSDDAKAEFGKGLEYWQTGAYTDGVKHFRRAYELDNGFALAHVFSMGEYDARLHSAELDRAVGDAARQSAQEGVAALFWREKAFGHWAEDKALLRAAMQMMPNEPFPAVEYLWASIADGTDPKQALDSARAFRARFPNYPALAFPVPFLAMAAKDTAGALRAAEELTRAAPNMGAGFGYYGALFQQLGRYDEAVAQFRKGIALATHPDYGWDPASALAEMYVLRGRYTDARVVATDAIAHARDASDSATYMAEVAATWFATGDNQRGMQLLEQARRKSATVGGVQNPTPLDYILAEASALTGDLSATRSYLSRVRPESSADSAVLYANYTADYAYAGQLDSALAYADRMASVKGVPWAANAVHHARAVALAAAKQCSRARTELAQAPDTASLELLLTRADCELQLGNRALALALRDRAIASPEIVLYDPIYARQRVRLAQMK
jgi:tetratricopeptide (TPR) repeat protein